MLFVICNLNLFYLVLIGLAGGSLGGLLGVGGGLITVPALHLLRGEPMHVAVGASLFSNAVVGAASAWRYSLQGRVSKAWVMRIVAGTLVGGLGGIFVASSLSGEGLRKVFGAFAALSALDLFIQRKGSQEDGLEAPPPPWSAAAVVGLPTGFAAGILGIGGGIVAVPLQRRIYRVPIKVAIGNSAASIPFTCVLAGSFALRAFEGQSPGSVLAISGLMALGGLVGALASATLSARVSAKALRVVFSVFLALTAFRMLK